MRQPWKVELVKPSGSWEVDIVKPDNKVDFELGEKFPYALPIATPEKLGGVQPDGKTEEMTLPVGVDEQGKLWTSGSDEAVLFVEQTLTDEQRRQARKNIAEFPCDWHEVTGYNPPATGVHVLSSIGTPYNTRVFDIEAMASMTSSVLTQYSAIGCLHGCVKTLWNDQYSSRNNVQTWMGRIVTDFEAIRNAGLIEDKLWITVKEVNADTIDYSYCVYATSSIATHSIQFYDRNHVYAGVINYNKDTGVASIEMSANAFTDESLTKVDYAADAKAVGDALALKADKSELELKADRSELESKADKSDLDKKIDRSEIEEEDALAIVVDMELVSPVIADNGSIYTDENGALYSL